MKGLQESMALLSLERTLQDIVLQIRHINQDRTEQNISVPPTYGYIALALVKCSNDGGPGPGHNMKEDPLSSIFSMLVVYGYYLHLLTSSQNQVTGRTSVDPLPPFKPTWAKPPPSPLGYLLHHLQR
jgi:hypothetical protein